MNRIIVVIVLLFPFTLLAQKTNYCIGLENGEIINTRFVRYKTPLFGREYILANDHDRFELEEVAFYQNEDGYFKKLTPPGWPKEAFFKREVEGERIEVYSKMGSYTSYSPGASVGSTGMGIGIGIAPNYSFVKYDYYSKDNGDLLKLSYTNLNRDLADNRLSTEMLGKVKTLRTITGILYVTGAAFTIAGVANTFNNSSNDSGQQIQISPFLVAGIIALAIPNFLHSSKRRKMIEASMAYNR